MKIHYIAIILGLAIIPVSYAQPVEQGADGVDNPCACGKMHGQGRWEMRGPGMGCGMGCKPGMPGKAEGKPTPQAQTNSSPKNDLREFVEMPAKALQLMRQDMLNHLVALTQILGLLATDKLNEAAEIAETQIGNSARGKHRGTGMGPGRFMPFGMRQMGWSMHQAASDFAKIAKQGDTKQAYAALQKVSATCLACHHTYRTR